MSAKRELRSSRKCPRGKYRRERYPKRPLMGPAIKESARHVAKMWKDAVK